MIIQDISDTARWVALHRAWESERPDAHFRDRFARRLAGERGEAMARRVTWDAAAAWTTVARTCVFDELILEAVGQGFDLVLNLAAGLDTRPYRLDLPPALRWMEVDYPEVLQHKRAVLDRETASCQLESVAMDLSDQRACRALLDRVGPSASAVLVVTEGLLTYLPEEQVCALASDLHRVPAVRRWLADLASARAVAWWKQHHPPDTIGPNVEFRFAPEQGPAFFLPYGWECVDFRSTLDEARRLKRAAPLAWLVLGMDGARALGSAVLERRSEDKL